MKVFASKLAKLLSYVFWRIRYAQRLVSLKDKYKGEDVVIIGNGPSIASMRLNELDRDYTIGLNKIHLIQKTQPFVPTFLVAVNELVIEQSLEDFRVSEAISFIRQTKDTWAGKGIDYPIHDSINFEPFSRDCSKGLKQGGTVTFSALQIAYYLGFRRVFLIGVDHTFAQTGSANDTQTMVGDDVNHFDPDYFKGQTWQLADLPTSERSYALARQVFEADGRKIYDATINGKLEIFEKMDYHEALRQLDLNRKRVD